VRTNIIKGLANAYKQLLREDLMGAKLSLREGCWSSTQAVQSLVNRSAVDVGDELATVGGIPPLRVPCGSRLQRFAETIVGPIQTNTLLATCTLRQVLLEVNEFSVAHALLKMRIQRLDTAEAPALYALLELNFLYGITLGGCGCRARASGACPEYRAYSPSARA
jgi:hypothetical protein